MKRILIALALIALASAVVPTDGSARGGRGFYGHHRGYHGGSYTGLRGPAIGLGFGFAAPYAYSAYGDYGCFQTRRVWTPYGSRLRRFYVCG